MLEYFDSHSHLNLSPLREEKEKIIAELAREKIGTITVGTDFQTSGEAIEIAKNNPNIWATVGLHPTDSEEEFDYEKFKLLASESKVVAIGECGLDYFHPGDKEKQKEIFLKQIQLANEVKKPLMIHCRPSKRTVDAYRDLISILKDYPSTKANMHFFGGNLEIAKELLELGFTISFAGPITFVPDYDKVIEYLPLDMILSETDAPFAAPAPFRGRTCYPYYVSEVVKKIAEVKKIDLEEVKKQLVANVRRVFMKF